ncbi:hypothetical protein [Sinorhizobium meliloti]|uniref:hypothetical protein n=1 Tax=Rhizobium meliloti TaxID=382 RepID=UPI000B4A0EE0|nr:hypothetical protein [Sinorhizobium meliloti]ASQ11080.1 hypothetical protein CDO22_13515 [Sinorhizobium meliloti]MQU85747.1 hypothetical protein [Sinorhizobium meliloti]MQU89283.1 hypothetical protein [Sinorhizobium meliloti]
MQRRILALLTEQGMTCPQLARRIYGEPTASQQFAVRRAVRRLADAGHIGRVHSAQVKRAYNEIHCAAWAEADLAAKMKAEWKRKFPFA